jgi:signal transduction histidine kinase
MLRSLRVRLTLIYLGFSFLFVVIIGAGLYLFLTRYFQTTTDRALEYRLVQQLEYLGLPVPPDLVAVKFIWQTNISASNHPSAIFTPLPTIQAESGESNASISPGESGDGESSDADNLNPNSPTPAPTLTGREGFGSASTPGEFGETMHDYDGELSSVFFMQVDPEGKLISGGSAASPPIQPILQKESAPSSGRFNIQTVSDPGGNQVRLLTFALPEGAPARYFQFGRPIADQIRLMREYLMGLLILSGISLVLMAIGSWVVAGRSIHPVQVAIERQQEFVANASHELRTPLTLIRGTAELAALGTREKEAKTALKEIIQDTDYMSGMVEDLLLLSRIDSGNLVFDWESVDIEDVLLKVKEQSTRMLSEKGINVDLRTEPLQAMADGQRLRQVLWILIDNAAHFTSKGGMISLAAKREGELALISVSDTGSGIPVEHIERVFDRFYQAGSGSGQNGAGLGLSLAKTLVEGMRGRIELKSSLGKGTRVTVYLPLA